MIRSAPGLRFGGSFIVSFPENDMDQIKPATCPGDGKSR